MDWITVVLFLASTAVSLYNSSNRDNGMPDLPGYIAPDLGPLSEQGAFADYQNKTRNSLLSEFYGGSITGGNTTFGGRLPSRQYKEAQEGLLESSAADFSPELAEYMAARGINPGDQVAGAQAELGNTYDQRAREINAKSHDIYALTLGSLFGEVSDTGMQGAQLVGQTMQANQMENARRDQAYNSAMNRWQYESSRPNAMETIGGMLPMLASMYKGSGTSSGSYDAGSAGSNAYAPQGYSQWNPPPSSFYRYGG